MTRFSKEGSPIRIEYGTDHAVGVFLAVYDERRPEIDGEPQTLDYYTGPMGIGKKLSHKDMTLLLMRHGVADEQIASLFADLKPLAKERGLLQEPNKCRVCIKETSNKCTKCDNAFYCSRECQAEDLAVHSTKCDLERSLPRGQVDLNNNDNVEILPAEKVCAACKKPGGKSCSKCHSIYYCSRECQEKEWKIHKLICDLKPYPKLPQSNGSNRWVYGIYFGENGAKAKMIPIEVKRMRLENDPKEFDDPVSIKTPDLLGDHVGRNIVHSNTSKGIESLPNQIEVMYRDNFFSDGSQKNKLVDRVAQNKNKYDWHGLVIAMKFKGDYTSEKYMNAELSDLNDLSNFFVEY